METSIAIFLTLLTAPFWVIFLKRRIERWLVRRLEVGKLNSPSQGNPGQGDGSRQTIFFPLATVSSCIVVIIVLSLSNTSAPRSVAELGKVDPGEVERRLVHFILETHLLSLLLALAALYLHYSGRSTRRLKYDLALTAIFLPFLLRNIAARVTRECKSLSEQGILDQSPERIFIVSGLSALVLLAVFMALQCSAFWGSHRYLSRERASILFYHLQSHVLLIVFVFAKLLVIYCLVRFHVFYSLSDRPILYFRSFRNEDSPAVFAKIVSKAARRFGIIEGLVHRTQPASALQASVDITEQAHFSVSPDSLWQSWVIEKVRSASVVIVDATDETDSLNWEIAQAVEAVGAARVAVLCKEGKQLPSLGEIWHAEYTMDRRGIRRCRQELRNWLRNQRNTAVANQRLQRTASAAR
jgi:hypothetical protein